MKTKARHTVSVDVFLVTEAGSGLVEVRTTRTGHLLGRVEIQPNFYRSTPALAAISSTHETIEDAADDIVRRTVALAARSNADTREEHRSLSL